jgi:hypothetical protein
MPLRPFSRPAMYGVVIVVPTLLFAARRGLFAVFEYGGYPAISTLPNARTNPECIPAGLSSKFRT